MIFGLIWQSGQKHNAVKQCVAVSREQNEKKKERHSTKKRMQYLDNNAHRSTNGNVSGSFFYENLRQKSLIDSFEGDCGLIRLHL